MAKKRKRSGPSWRPRLRGGTYCSPACGGGCTFDAYIAATNAATLLAKRLGQGWKARVWENLGWHYRVFKGPLELDRNGNMYSCLLSGSSSCDNSGAVLWSGVRYYRTPEAAVRAQLALARRVLRRLQRTIEAAS